MRNVRLALKHTLISLSGLITLTLIAFNLLLISKKMICDLSEADGGERGTGAIQLEYGADLYTISNRGGISQCRGSYIDVQSVLILVLPRDQDGELYYVCRALGMVGPMALPLRAPWLSL